MASTSTSSVSIDEQKRQLYNRQEYVVGAETQAKYGNTSVLVVGASGPAAEIVKNLALTGVKAIKICDDTPVELADLGTNFFAVAADVGMPRSAVIAKAAAELNRFVEVSAVSGDVLNLIPTVQVAVFVNHFIPSLVKENEVARAHKVKFVACETRGIAGSIFVDAGPSFDVLDTDGEDTVSCVVTAVNEDGLVTVQEDKNHECEVGSQIYFTGMVSPASANSQDPATVPRGVVPKLRLFEVAEVISPHILRVKGLGELAGSKPIDVGTSTYLHSTKRKVTMTFLPLAQSVEAPEVALIFDAEAKMSAPATLHAVSRAVAASGAIPHSPAEVHQAVEKARSFCAELDVPFAEQVLATYGGDLNPMACFIGGLSAQEVLKVCSGKFTPLHQWMYYDARELLTARAGVSGGPAGSATVADLMARSPSTAPSRFAGQEAVLGERFQAFLSSQTAFIVGAGALGCELIKNIALMGFGGVSITDMDQIEMSNLSRQFLFRHHHIGSPKSQVAANAAQTFNPNLRITSYESKVGPETEGVFNETFWNAHSVIVNALDNIHSRKYVDARCLFYKKPLFESGTLGTKCNMQCVIPFVTESYSSSYDPPEKMIPLCTLKNFPNAIEHTIQWARDQFHLLFNSIPKDVNVYLDNPAGFASALERDPAAAGTVLRNVYQALTSWPTTEADCVKMARLFYHDYFNESFRQLLHNLPLDKRNEDGQPFWSGAKKPPTPQEFNPANQRDVDFIFHTASLLAEVYGLPPLALSPAQAAQIAASVPTPAFVPRQAVYATSEAEQKDNAPSGRVTGEVQVSDLPPPERFAGRHMKPVEFEKDDPTNHHVDFITYCSNVRAEAYSIPPADLIRTKRIAGHIIPAMVTTTSLVTGLVGFEMLKYLLVQFNHVEKNGPKLPYVPSADEITAQLSLFRSAFVNIALPFLAFSDPIIAQGKTYELPSGRKLRWSVWDRIDVDEGRDVLVKELVQILETRYEMEVFMVALTSGKLLFMQFGGKAKDKEKLVSVVAQEKGEEMLQGNDYLDLVVSGMIGEDDEVDVPTVRYKFRNF